MGVSITIFDKYASLFRRQTATRISGLGSNGSVEYFTKNCFNFYDDEIDDSAIKFLNTFKGYDISNQTFIWGCLCYCKYSQPFEDEYSVQYALDRKDSVTLVFTLLTTEGIHQLNDGNYKFTSWNDKATIKFWFDKNSVQYLAGNTHNNNAKKWKALFREIAELRAIPFDNDSKLRECAPEMAIDKKKIEYVIGIDLGHGETSAAIAPMQWDKLDNQLDAAKDLEMEPNKKVIPSAITITADGTAKIGTAAFDPNILKQAKVNVCFKKKPQDIDGEAEKLMIRFMQEVYRKIRENNSGMLTDGNHLVYIATPSGWDKEAQNLYLEMAKRAGLPMGGITKESRAAFVRAQHDPTANLGRNIEKGAIVFDMGSSTLDFTYHNSSLTNMIDNGYDCGASFVEKSMFAKLEESNEAIQGFRSKYPDLVDYLLFEVRCAKEEIYFDTNRKYKKTINFEDFIDDEDFEDERFRLKFETGELNEFLETNGYIGSIREAMRDYINNHIPGQNIYGVFLTGGASRMDFIKPLVVSCWNVPEDKIFRDQDPSLTISEGVAEVARVDLRTSDMDSEIGPLFARVNGNTVYDRFVEIFGNYLFENVAEKVEGKCIEWRDYSMGISLNRLNEFIKKGVKETVAECSTQVNEGVRRAIEAETKELREKVDAIVAAYTAQGTNVKLPSLDDLEVMKGNAGIDMSGVIRDISNQIETDSSSWGGLIAGAGIGAAVAMILGGPLAWIIGGGALLGKLFFGGEKETEEQKRKKAMAKDLNEEERAAVCNTLSEKWGEITTSIHDSVFNSLQKNNKARRDVANAVDNLMKAYKEALQKARIMVD